MDMRYMGLIFTPVIVKHLLDTLGLFGPMTSIPLGLVDAPYSCIGRYNPLLAAHLPPPPTPNPSASLPTHPLVCAIYDTTVVVKKLLKIQQC